MIRLVLILLATALCKVGVAADQARGHQFDIIDPDQAPPSTPISLEDMWYNTQLSVDGGIYGFTHMETGIAQHVQGAYFFGHHWGVRSGFSYIRRPEALAYMVRIPLLVALRTPTSTVGFADMEIDSDEYLRSIISGFVLALFNQAEINAGLGLAYMRPGAQANPQYLLHRRMGVSVDINVRLTNQAGPIGIVVTPGLSYYLTRNLYNTGNHLDPLDMPSTPDYARIALGISLGASYRF